MHNCEKVSKVSGRLVERLRDAEAEKREKTPEKLEFPYFVPPEAIFFTIASTSFRSLSFRFAE